MFYAGGTTTEGRILAEEKWAEDAEPGEHIITDKVSVCFWFSVVLFIVGGGGGGLQCSSLMLDAHGKQGVHCRKAYQEHGADVLQPCAVKDRKQTYSEIVWSEYVSIARVPVE